MAKSRTKRAREKELQGFRKFLFWFFTCGRRVDIEEDEVDDDHLHGELEGLDGRPNRSANGSGDTAYQGKLSQDKKNGPKILIPKRPPAPKRLGTANKSIDTSMVDIVLDDKMDAVKENSLASVDDATKMPRKAVPQRPPPPKKATSQRSPGVILSICEVDRTMNVPLFDIIQGDDFATVRRQTALEEAAFGDASGPRRRPPPPKHIFKKGSNSQEKSQRPNRPPPPKRALADTLESIDTVNITVDKTKTDCLVVQDGPNSGEDEASKTAIEAAVDEYPDHLNPFAEDSDVGDDDGSTTDGGNVIENDVVVDDNEDAKAKGEDETNKTPSKTAVLDEYPGHLNPFADDSDADDDDGSTTDDGNVIKNDDCFDENDDKKGKDTSPNSIEDYPEDLNPFAEDDDVTVEIADEY